MEKNNRRIYVKVTNECNKQCSFCYYHGDTKPKGCLELQTMKEIMEKEQETHEETRLIRVILTGGEPTLCPHLAEIVEYLTGLQRMQLVIETNGTNFENQEFTKILDHFKEGNYHYLKIAMNNELLDSEPGFREKIINFIKAAKENKIRFILNARYKDEADKANLQKFIVENDLGPAYGEVYYYPLHEYNFYRDGELPTFGFPFIIYDYDGSVLMWDN